MGPSSPGMLKAAFGISATVYATIYSDIFEPDGLAFMRSVPIVTAALALVALPVFNIVPFRQAQECPGGGAQPSR